MYVVSQVRRCLSRQRREDKTRQFEVDSSLDWKPVQLAQHWRDVVPSSSSSSSEKPSGGILDDSRSFHHRSIHHRPIHDRSLHPRVRKTILLAVGAVLTGFLRRSHTTLVGLICAFVRWMSACEELATAMPQHQGMNELLTYLMHTYIHGRRLPNRGCNYRSALFPPASWNKRESVTEGIALLQIFVISISCEGWHNSLQSLLLCNHPSMRTLSDGIMKRLQCKLPVSFGQLVEVNEH